MELEIVKTFNRNWWNQSNIFRGVSRIGLVKLSTGVDVQYVVKPSVSDMTGLTLL